MRRPTVRRQQPSVALFPFLAVLICTMGSLIVLLVLVVHQAKASAAARMEARANEQRAASAAANAGVRVEAEDLLWRAGMLESQREEHAKELSNKRLELAHLEDHIRRLEDQAKQLIAQAQSLASQDLSADDEAERRRLKEIQALLAEKEDELQRAKEAAAKRKPVYAIIPYEGPNGTNRRPIYIECREDGIYLQPEGVVLSAADFEGPLGPGNPLDASLRTVREHWAARGVKGEPYPLVIVRPNGAVAFGACRSAMKHWENEFGYELVDQEMELNFPPADPQLAATLQRTVRDARSRQTALAAAMPSRFGSETRTAGFRSESSSASPAGYESSSGGSFGSGRGGSGVGAGGGSSRTGTTTAGGSGYGPGGTATDGGTGVAGNSSASKTGATGGASGTASNGATGSSSAGQARPGGVAGGTASSGSTTSGQPTGGFGSRSNGSSGSAGGQTASSGATNGASQQGSGTNGSQGGSSSSPSANATSSSGKASNKAKKAASVRGDNFGLPLYSDRATAIKRPIRVQLYEDRMVLLPERGDTHAPLIIPIEEHVGANLDVLLDSVWRHMDRWGLAVLGGYWKPVLSVEVQPGGEERFLELGEMLERSGIEVERKRL